MIFDNVDSCVQFNWWFGCELIGKMEINIKTCFIM